MYATFERQAAAQKSRYEKKKALGICADCGKPDERTRSGLTRCAECYRRGRERGREYARMLYAERKGRGLCVMCGKEDAYTMIGRSMCADCCERDRERQRKKHGWKPRGERIEKETKIPAWERPAYGLCYFCGEPVAGRVKSNGEPVRTCERCWQRCMENARKAMEAKGGSQR